MDPSGFLVLRALMHASLLVGWVGCGACDRPREGAQLGSATDLTIVAHEDDDLLLMQPDLYELAARGGLVNVYITAGNGRHGADRADDRIDGLKQAYGAIAGSFDWACGDLAIVGHTVQHCRLAEANISLVFMGYPDGGIEGEMPTSLLHLWQGEVGAATTISHTEATYTRDGLIDTLAAVIDSVGPHTVRTLEIASTHGRDHSDHMFAGALALLATARSHTHPELISYRGYSIGGEPTNTNDPIFTRSRDVLARYEACDTGCAPCGRACANITENHDELLHRHYAVGMRRRAGGILHGSLGCLRLDRQGGVVFGDCEGAPRVELAEDGTLHINGRCLETDNTEVISTTTECAPLARRRVFLDDEGHIWLGEAPAPRPGMTYRHLRCLDIDRDRVIAGLCGADHAPTWTVDSEHTKATWPVGITQRGRAVRLADVDGDRRADLCAIENGELWCAKGTGAGQFAAAVSIGKLPVEPESLVIADLDNDGAPDACGRTAQGIVCALPASAGPKPWATALDDASDRSLTAADARGDGTLEICGLAAGGVTCVPRGGLPVVLSPWSIPGSTWFGDLDGDRRADWCAVGPTSVMCGRAANIDLTTAGVPWSYSYGGVVDPLPGPALGGLADIDGDGRVDLCTARDFSVTCARSLGRGFGPQIAITLLPGPPIRALWLGDLDGDGVADVCVDNGTIWCRINAR